MAHVLYNNYVLESKIENFLTTTIGINNYMTVDNSLASNAGDIKYINTYTFTGNVEDLAMGVGNSQELDVAFTTVSYPVITTQGYFHYYDEQEAKDPMVVEVGMKALADSMTNDLTAKAIAEFGKANLTHTMTNWDFNDFADAIALYPYENEDGLFCLINPAEKAKIRKALQDDLKYVEANARTGYIGSVCGVPIIVSKAVPAGEAYLATKEAVTCFVKKGVEIEQDRDADIRDNQIWARKVMVVALTDATRVIKLQ